MNTFRNFLPILLLAGLASCVSNHRDRSETAYTEEDKNINFDFNGSDSVDFSDPSYTTDRRKIGLGEAKSAQVDISIPAGILSVKGGSDELVHAAVRYRSDQREFNVWQELQGDHIKARISMPYHEGIRELKDEGSACSIRLNEKIPMDLDLNLGAGKGKFDLGMIHAGKIRMGLGAGEFDIRLIGTPATDLKIDAGVGEAVVNLTGERKNDLDAVLNCGIGNLTLIVPQTCAVKISISGFLGNITGDGLSKKGDDWFTEAWEKDGPRMRVRINGAIGDITLKAE